MFLRKQKKRDRVRSRSEKTFAFHIVWGVLRLLVVVAFFGMVYYLTHLPVFTVSTVIVEGGETISHADIEARTQEVLLGNYLGLIPKRFTFLYPHDQIVSVLESVPRIHDVKVVRTARDTLVVSFAEYMPHALACVYEHEDTPCYFITTDGYAFAEAPLLRGGTLVRHMLEGAEEITKTHIIQTDILHALESLIARIETELGFRMTTIVHKKNGDYELLINGGGKILVSNAQDFETAFDNLQTVLNAKEFSHIRPGNFQYIDARFGEKIFVNETLPDAHIDSQTATGTPVGEDTATTSLSE